MALSLAKRPNMTTSRYPTYREMIDLIVSLKDSFDMTDQHIISHAKDLVYYECRQLTPFEERVIKLLYQRAKKIEAAYCDYADNHPEEFAQLF